MPKKFLFPVVAVAAIFAAWQLALRLSPAAKPSAGSELLDAPAEFNAIGELPAPDPEALRALMLASEPAGKFWFRDNAAEADRIEAILAAEQQARTALVAEFGQRVEDSAQWWHLFRPLHTRMPELGVTEQLRIHELERRFAARSLRSNNMAQFDDHISRIAEQVGPDIATEYALNTSLLAEELRNIEREFTENEFRTAFAALSALNTPGDSESFVRARRQLRTSLGTSHFARLWSARDPRFERFRAVGARYELAEEKLLSAYGLWLENQDAMLTVATTANAQDRQQQLREQHEIGRRRLQELVGAAAADALLQVAAMPVTR